MAAIAERLEPPTARQLLGRNRGCPVDTGHPHLHRRPPRPGRLGPRCGISSEHGFTNLILRSLCRLRICATPPYRRPQFAETRPEAGDRRCCALGRHRRQCRLPSRLFSDNVRIQVNLLDSAVAYGVAWFLFLGSSCIYPVAPQPISRPRCLVGNSDRPTRATPWPNWRASPTWVPSGGSTVCPT